jgi:hypothetical protein
VTSIAVLPIGLNRRNAEGSCDFRRWISPLDAGREIFGGAAVCAAPDSGEARALVGLKEVRPIGWPPWPLSKYQNWVSFPQADGHPANVG